MSETGIRMRILTESGHINLRGDPHNKVFRKAAEAALGQPLPVDANSMSAGDHRVYWLGPDEWLITTTAEGKADLLAALHGSLQDHHAAVNDVSGGTAMLQLSGETVRDVLAKGCTLDFHPDAFKVGHCAQSGLGKANVLFGLIDDAPTFNIIVRSSFADYLSQWLQRAGREYGIEFR